MKIDVATIVAIVGVLMTMAAIYGAFRVSRNTQATALYRENALAWEGKAKIQEDDIKELKERLGERDEKIRNLEATVTVLRDTVTGKVVLDTLAQQVGSLVQAQDDMLRLLQNNQSKLDEIHARLN